MANDYDDTNRGVLFKNKYKEKDSQPDYKGDINVDGKELEIAAWIKTSKAGNKFMSLSVSEPYEERQQPKKSGSITPISSSVEEVTTVSMGDPGKDDDAVTVEDIPF